MSWCSIVLTLFSYGKGKIETLPFRRIPSLQTTVLIYECLFSKFFYPPLRLWDEHHQVFLGMLNVNFLEAIALSVLPKTYYEEHPPSGSPDCVPRIPCGLLNCFFRHQFGSNESSAKGLRSTSCNMMDFEVNSLTSEQAEIGNLNGFLNSSLG